MKGPEPPPGQAHAPAKIGDALIPIWYPSTRRLRADFAPWFSPLRLTNDNRSLLAFNLSYLFEREELLAESMTRLLGWLSEGRLRPPPLSTYPFDRVAEAHRALESGSTVGKLVLAM